MIESVRSTVAAHSMFRRGERVLIGVSGGPDSLALLSVLVALAPERRLHLRAAYVDHGLRPASARKEAAFVRRMGKRWGVPVRVVSRKVKRGKGESLESAARRVRYGALTALAKKSGCGVIAVGHNADDQAETVLMWLIRGSGTAGLSGIPPVREEGELRIVRPLLDCLRKEILAYLRRQGLRPLQDESNRSTRFLRNRIRHHLLGLLEQYNPRLRAHLCATAQILREENHWLEEETGRIFSSVARRQNGSVVFDLGRLKGLPPVVRRALLRSAVRRLQGNTQGLAYKNWMLLDRLAAGPASGGMDLPHGLKARIEKGSRLVLRCGKIT